NLQARYAAETGVPSLKIRHNNVLGYHIEVTPPHAAKLGDGFIHRQTLASSVRYGTVELGALETRISSAAEKALALELECFEALVADVMSHHDSLARAAAALAQLDVSAALAELAAAE